MAGAGLYYGQGIPGSTRPKPKPKRLPINIEGYGKFYVDEVFLTLDKAKQNEVVAGIMKVQDEYIPTFDMENAKTTKDVATTLVTQAPGAWAGAKAGAAIAPVFPHPLATGVSKGVGMLAGGILGGEATERLLTPVANALTPPKEWDDNQNQFKNLAHDFVTGQWDDW